MSGYNFLKSFKNFVKGVQGDLKLRLQKDDVTILTSFPFPSFPLSSKMNSYCYVFEFLSLAQCGWNAFSKRKRRFPVSAAYILGVVKSRPESVFDILASSADGQDDLNPAHPVFTVGKWTPLCHTIHLLLT